MTEGPSKEERYFSGSPKERLAQRDPRQPLPGEVPPGLKSTFVKIGIGIGVFAAGVMAGIFFSPEGPEDLRGQIAELEHELRRANAQAAQYKRELTYRQTDKVGSQGRLKAEDRRRHAAEGDRLSSQLRRAHAAAAADLFEWFVGRWNALLDSPRDDDRVDRRAVLLARLVGGMGKNLDPGDYVQWQIDLLSGQWLGELHVDLDGDGIPSKRRRDNPKDGFADVSVCQVAMALNQLVTDAHVLVMPEMRCDSPRVKISIFLPGRTRNDALTELVRFLKKEGFLVVQQTKKGIRQILIGPGSRAG